jgi:cytoskeletal protein RodZ
MAETFGARLRCQREQREIALAAIAAQTKISLSLLEGLERDDVSRWPAGIFRRAFVRDYARAIGLDPDTVTREFLELYPDPREEAMTASGGDSAGEESSAVRTPSTRFRYLVNAAVGSLPFLRQRADARPSRDDSSSDTGKAHGAQTTADAAPAMAAAPEPCVDAAGTPVDAAASDTPVDAAAADTPVDAGAADTPVEAAAAATLVEAPAVRELDLGATARLCTELGRVDAACDLPPLVAELARIVGAPGLIVWVWNPQADELWPVLAHGYSEPLLARLPRVKPDEPNATAAAFRSGEPCAVAGANAASDALVVPLLTPSGCAGVLAIELQHGAAKHASTQAIAAIVAAQIARLVRPPESAAAADRRLA